MQNYPWILQHAFLAILTNNPHLHHSVSCEYKQAKVTKNVQTVDSSSYATDWNIMSCMHIALNSTHCLRAAVERT